MGQKTHPTGFRIGINKPYHSTWFANFDVYSSVLQEDYKIRQFCDCSRGCANQGFLSQMSMSRDVAAVRQRQANQHTLSLSASHR